MKHARSFTLDGMGNRVGEQITDSTGALAWTATRTINSLNRLAAKTDGPNQTDTFGRDFNGELVTESNGLNQSTRYDAVGRITGFNAVGSQTGGSQQCDLPKGANGVQWLKTFENKDTVTRARDFKSVPTSYPERPSATPTRRSARTRAPWAGGIGAQPKLGEPRPPLTARLRGRQMSPASRRKTRHLRKPPHEAQPSITNQPDSGEPHERAQTHSRHLDSSGLERAR